MGTEKARNSAAEGAFQRFSVLSDQLAAPIPDEMDFEQAAVLPLGVSTAASALFQPDLIGLRLPRATRSSPLRRC